MYKNTLPFSAKHKVSDTETIDHFYLHGFFGSHMTNVTKRNLDKNSFVLTSSTVAGSGKIGLAHVFNKNVNNYANLNYTLANLLNFNMFGIPNVGGNICGWENKDLSNQDKEKLCLASF